MKKLLQVKKYLPEIAFVALLIKSLVVGSTLPEALALISLVSSMTYTKWLNKYKDDRYDRMEKVNNDRHLALTTQLEKIQQDFDDRAKTIENRVSSLYVEKSVKAVTDEKPKAGILGSAKRHF